MLVTMQSSRHSKNCTAQCAAGAHYIQSACFQHSAHQCNADKRVHAVGISVRQRSRPPGRPSVSGGGTRVARPSSRIMTLHETTCSRWVCSSHENGGALTDQLTAETSEICESPPTRNVVLHTISLKDSRLLDTDLALIVDGTTWLT